ncbi:MAG TPA: guanylate kinase [Anaeromyxobacteraceae bacterium]|nr:guanylate kinase [Anaeromyxobacteraceae bacterium]
MKLIVLTAPSGAGKTTIARRLMEAVPGLRFSISATTRPPRPGERDGVDYFFLSDEAFRAEIEAGTFVEYEEVYPGRFYGTLRRELDRLAEGPEGAAVVLDLDVKGALNVKRLYGDQALTLFIQPPSLAVLAERLRNRGTETEDRITVRLARAEEELGYARASDAVVVNDDLEKAVAETAARVRAFLAG